VRRLGRRCEPAVARLCEPTRARRDDPSAGRYSAPVADPDDRLRSLLGGPPPAAVLALDPAARTELADLLADARRRQAASLEAAFAATLKHVPFPVRGVVRKVLLG
jgi:hypothetical protein